MVTLRCSFERLSKEGMSDRSEERVEDGKYLDVGSGTAAHNHTRVFSVALADVNLRVMP
jgi:hypothetical protein